MGQYYKATILKSNKKTVQHFWYSWNYDNGAKLLEHSYVGNNYVNEVLHYLMDNPARLVWAGDYADKCKGYKSCVYDRCTDTKEVKSKRAKNDISNTVMYVLNHSKKCYVKVNGYNGNLTIHPLPLLTAEGNGRGGGDYISKPSLNAVGTWSRDIISTSRIKPTTFKEVKFNFKEIWD